MPHACALCCCAVCGRTGLIMDPAVTPKPQLCPLCAAGKELCHLLNIVPQSEGFEEPSL